MGNRHGRFTASVTTPSRTLAPLRPRPGRQRVAIALLATLAASTAACGSGDTTAASPSETATTVTTDQSTTTAGSPDSTGDGESTGETPASVVQDVFAAVDVLDVRTGETVDLRATLAGGDTPVLLWFWAPH